MTGWWDFLSQGTVAMFQELASQTDPPPHRLVIGPWSHGFGGGQGVVDYGPESLSTYAREVVRWYDERFKEPSPVTAVGVSFFVLNLNQWRHADTWPPRGGGLSSSCAGLAALAHRARAGSCRRRSQAMSAPIGTT